MSEPDTEPETICCCFRKKRKPTSNINKAEVAVTAKVPFAADLPKDLTRKAICVTGIVLPKCPRFAVNLTCGRGPTADVAFHLNPRLLQRYVVRNSCINGQWGQEEKNSVVKFPFGRSNSKFRVDILAGEGEFFVAVDGALLCTYKFRVPLAKVTGIEVQGNVDVLNVEYKPLEKFPDACDSPPAVKTTPAEEDSPAATPKIGQETPVIYSLPEGFQRDWQLDIYGRVKILPYSFHVNLQHGTQRWPHPEIPLHLNPRFGLVSGDPVFVRNAWLDSGWGQEERTPGFQFEAGSPFTMAIRRGDDHFSVWIDGKLAGEFKFRGAADNIDTLLIEGDALVFDVFLDKGKDFAPAGR